jgi:programmed cell death protein 5
MMETDEEVKKRVLHQLQGEHGQEEDLIKAQKQRVLRQILEPKAKERLARIKIARPQIVELIENQLIALVQGGQISGQISDDDLKIILSKLMPKKRDITIRRK